MNLKEIHTVCELKLPDGQVKKIGTSLYSLIKSLSDCQKKQFDRKRSTDHNAYYWAAVIDPMSKHTGYTPEEMHEILLVEIYGITMKDLKGNQIPIANKRTSSMTKLEFMDHIERCKVIAAEMGVLIQSEDNWHA